MPRADEKPPDEYEVVLAWRELRALDLRVPPQEAEVFAYSEGDLHDLERLIAAGCPPTLAFLIVT